MTLAQLQTALQQYGYGTDTATAQTEFLNAAYRRIVGLRRWPFLETQSTAVSTIVGTPAYNLAAITDLLHIDAVRIEVGTEYPNLSFLPPQEFRNREHIDRANGVPEYWTYINGNLRLYPRPDRIYTITLDYAKDPPDLSAAGDIPVLPVTYHDALVWGAIAGIAFRERDWTGNSYAEQRFANQVREMMEELGVRQRQSSRHVRRSGVWDQISYGSSFPEDA